MRLTHMAMVATVLVVAAGCQRTSVGTADTLPQPAPLPPVPSGTVRSSDLSAPTGDPNQFPQAPQPTDPGPSQQEVQMAAATAPEITRESMIGAWRTSVSGQQCDLFLALTKWEGGYRAATRGCPPGGALSTISAWDVQSNQVVLRDRTGNQVAMLYQSAPESYTGTTAGGQPISLSR